MVQIKPKNWFSDSFLEVFAIALPYTLISYGPVFCQIKHLMEEHNFYESH